METPENSETVVEPVYNRVYDQVYDQPQNKLGEFWDALIVRIKARMTEETFYEFTKDNSWVANHPAEVFKTKHNIMKVVGDRKKNVNLA
jgi:hypothetical protein